LVERASATLDAAKLALELRPGLVLGELVLVSGQVAKPLAVRIPCATRVVVELLELVSVGCYGCHVGTPSLASGSDATHTGGR
jgi:hypothetical protein